MGVNNLRKQKNDRLYTITNVMYFVGFVNKIMKTYLETFLKYTIYKIYK